MRVLTSEVKTMELDIRKKKILAAIVRDFIETAEPVGSRTISRKYDLKVSPATIRNEMADLEEMGLLEQPYTSAGRIPSNLGYRYYVDYLMEKVALNNEVKSIIHGNIHSKIRELEELIQETTKTLSQITNYTSLVLAPQMSMGMIQMVQLLLIEPGKALVVIITDTGQIENRILDIPEGFTKADLDLISSVLNVRLKKSNIHKWDKCILSDIYSQLVKQQKVLSTVIDLLTSIYWEEGEDKVYLGGALNILNQPEFKDITKVKRLFQLLEKEDVIRNVLQDAEEDGVTVRIGDENKYEGIQECSVITATYKLDGKVLGTIGVLGPTRMQYSHAVAIVEFLTQTLTATLKKKIKDI